MGNFIKTQTSFSNGELAPEFFATGDSLGLAHLENMDIVAGGALARRPGLARIASLPSACRLISFSLAENQDYVLALGAGYIKIFFHDELVQSLAMNWSDADIPSLQYAQRFGTMIFVHPNYKPIVLYKSGSVFKLRDFAFSYTPDGKNINMPFMRFEDTSDITITVTYPIDGVHFTTNRAFWTQSHLYGCFSLLGNTWIISRYISATEVVATCNGAFTVPDEPVSDWQEAMFSATRGWPSCITFHQDRLVFGGAKSWPGGVWLSRVGEHENFGLGTGLDDDAIFFTIVSDKRQQICTLISSNSLQILTSSGEWVVANVPLTPSSVDIKMQTAIGSVAERYLPPQKIEGATIFVANNKHDIRELALDTLGEKYNAVSLCELAGHLINDPQDIVYNKNNKQLFVVMADGTMAVLNRNVALSVSGWARYTTLGEFKFVTVVDDETFVVVKRGTNYYLEKFSNTQLSDSEIYPYKIRISGLPLQTSGHNAHKTRIKKVTVRVLNSKTLNVNGTSAIFPNWVYADDSPGFSGDLSVNILGTDNDSLNSPWEISSNDSLPLKILSVTIYGRYQI